MVVTSRFKCTSAAHRPQPVMPSVAKFRESAEAIQTASVSR